MELNSFQELLEYELRDIYSAERMILESIPALAESVGSDSLREVLEDHLHQTSAQVSRLERIAELLDTDIQGKKCRGVAALIEEAQELLEIEGDEVVIDAGLIAAIQRIEHYEISAYGTARAFAERLGYTQIADILSQSLDEESDADEALNAIAQDEINEEAAEEDEMEALEEMRERDQSDEKHHGH